MNVAAAVDHAPGLERAFGRPPEERAYRLRPSAIDGPLPVHLRGTWYLNGPARFERGGRRYRHWLDGDGMLAALRFDDDGVQARTRFVRGAKQRDEEAAGCALYRTFGTAFPGDRLLHGVALASPLNVSALPFAGRLLAFGEQGLPYEVDPETLETRGQYTFSGALNGVSPFAAHPKLDPATGELWNFGVAFASSRPCLNVYRFAPEGRLLERRRVPLAQAVSLHDFALAPRHLLFYLAPYRLDVEALVAGGSSLLDALVFEPRRGAELLIVPRDPQAPPLRVALGAGYSLHTLNAFEDVAAGTLTLDCLELERPVYDQYQPLPDLFSEVGPGVPVRLTVDLRDGTLRERRAVDYALAPDFAVIDPRLRGRAADDFWMLGIAAAGRPGRKFFDQLVHARWSAPRALDVWTAPAGQYLAGEPLLVPDRREHAAGTLLVPLWDSRREESALLLFDPREVAAGPRTRLRLESPLHLGFHTAFARRD